MQKLKTALVFISLVGANLELTIPMVDYPVYTDSNTVISKGGWEVKTPGYTEIMPGDIVRVKGKVIEESIVESSEINVICHIKTENCVKSVGDWVLIQISHLRHWAVTRFERMLPSPMAGLAAGILLGIKAQIPRDFYQELINSGTLHIVAASGFNVTIVGNIILELLTKFWGRRVGIMGGIVGIGFYVLLAGSSASVVRAGIMGSLALLAMYLGRASDARRLLWITALIMIMVNPRIVLDIGFQLSVVATFGLLYIEPLLGKRIKNQYLSEYLTPTLAATLATTPILWWYFGRVSLIGVIANLLILPIVPLVMLLAAVSLVIPLSSYILYVPLWWIVWVIGVFG